MKKKVGTIYECFGTYVLCTGNKQKHEMIGETFQGVIVQTNDEENYVGEYSDTWSSEQFIETEKKILL